MGPVHVADFPEVVTGPNPNASTFRRTLTLDGPPSPRDLWFRAIAAGKIEPLGDGWFRIDDEWKMRVEADAEPVLRKSAGKTELLVPLRCTAARNEDRAEFVW